MLYIWANLKKLSPKSYIMVYQAIGLMSGSSLDGLDMVFALLTETSGKWQYEIEYADCIPYEMEWTLRLKGATELSARDYMLLHTDYGNYTGKKVNEFIDMHQLQHRVHFIASHGHTTFHIPSRQMTHQIGDGAAIAAVTGLSVISDLRAMDLALHGQGAPIVPLGEKLLFPTHRFFLNIGGIANVSVHTPQGVIAFDVCPANAVLNRLANLENLQYDHNGEMASRGQIHQPLLDELNGLDFFKRTGPKSLSNQFGNEEVMSIIEKYHLATTDALATYTEHIALQLQQSLQGHLQDAQSATMMITGGGAFNSFLIDRMQHHLGSALKLDIPGEEVVQYKEALIMALLGVLRWREQPTVLSSVTGAQRDSIGGAMWMGSEV